MDPAALLSKMQEILDRSDTHFGTRSRLGEPIGRWKGKVPEDFHAFWSAHNGLYISWGFDASLEHGPRFYGLSNNGSGLICPDTRGARFAQMAARDHEYLSPEVHAWGDDPVLIFEGFQGEGGLLLRTMSDGSGQYYGFDSDGDVTLIASDLDAFLEAGLKSGFAYGWWRPGRADAVIAQLARTVPPREQLAIEVTAREEISSAQYRQDLGSSLAKGKYDAVMKALGDAHRYADDDAAGRGERFDALLADAAGISQAQAKAVLSALKLKGASLKALGAAMRWGEAPRQRVTLVATDLSAPGAPPIGVASVGMWVALQRAFPQDTFTMPNASLYKKRTATAVIELAGEREAAQALTVGWRYLHAGCIGRMDQNDY